MRRRVIGLVLGAVVVVGIYFGYRMVRSPGTRRDSLDQAFFQWTSGNERGREKMITEQSQPCPNAPFILPTKGYIGLLYGDPRSPYSSSHPHQGIDIFSLGNPGETPVYAAYDGYLTRQPSWRSAVIIRVPDDPVSPGHQIWLYYAHMSDSSGETSYIADAFPPGTREAFVKQGTLLGYTGNYSGKALYTVWVHLHFSIVLDDGRGNYLNELEFDNTVDPSRYLGMPVNYACASPVPDCASDPLCPEAILGAGGG